MCDPSLWGGATMAALASPLFLALLHLMHHTSAGESEEHIGGVAKPYTGPEFNAFDCYQDPSPVRYQLPNACTDKAGRPLYSSTAKYTKHTVNLYQVLDTFEFDAKFCVLEESTQDFLCGWQSWGELLAPPRVSVPTPVPPMACKQLWSRKLYTDTAYGKTFPIEEGVNHFAYQARGSLQVSGESVYCSGNTGRISTGELVQKSMLFKSVRLTLGRLKGRRQFKGEGEAVITQGELSGTALDPKQVSGRAIVMGQVTILLGANFFKSACPLSVVRRGLVMFQVPNPAGVDHKLSAKPGDRMYAALHDTEEEMGVPKLHPWVLLLSQSSDLVINLGNHFMLPDHCSMDGEFFKTSHAHIVAALDPKTEEKEMDLLPIDLELVAASDYSARIDLLSYLTTVALDHLQKKEEEKICLGDPKQVFTALRRSDQQKGLGRMRYLTAGEMIVQAQCHEVNVGYNLLPDSEFSNCTAMIPVRKLTDAGHLEGPQWWLSPSTRYLSRTPTSRHCDGLKPAFRDTEGTYWEVLEGQLGRVQPQPRNPIKLPSLQPEALPDLIDSVAGGQDVYTNAQREQVMEELDFSVFLQGPSFSTMQTARAVYKDRNAMRAGSSSTAGILPGWSAGKEYAESAMSAPLIYLWDQLGAPLFHFLVTLGSIFGLIIGLTNLWNIGHEFVRLAGIGGRLRGDNFLRRGMDIFTLGLSSTQRQARIREAENAASEQRILYSLARARGSRGNMARLQSATHLSENESEI